MIEDHAEAERPRRPGREKSAGVKIPLPGEGEEGSRAKEDLVLLPVADPRFTAELRFAPRGAGAVLRRARLLGRRRAFGGCDPARRIIRRIAVHAGGDLETSTSNTKGVVGGEGRAAERP